MCIIPYAELVVKLILGCVHADLVWDGGITIHIGSGH